MGRKKQNKLHDECCHFLGFSLSPSLLLTGSGMKPTGEKQNTTKKNNKTYKAAVDTCSADTHSR